MDKNIGIIGYGSMGKMLLDKFSQDKVVDSQALFIANRTVSKIEEASDRYTICKNNIELAVKSDIIFICLRPSDIKPVLEEIVPYLKEDSLLVSLNGSVSFANLEKISKRKYAKIIPSVTAEINQSQTLISYNDLITEEDKNTLKVLLTTIGNVIELPENELGMGSELVSCMPGFIASMFDVVCQSAKKHTSIPDNQIKDMVLNTMCATGQLMLENNMSFQDVVSRVATKGGITEVGSQVIYDGFPKTADEMFEKTLEKRKQTAENATKAFNE